MLPYSNALYRGIDTEITSYIRRELCMMTAFQECHHQWEKRDGVWSVSKNGGDQPQRTFYQSCIHLIPHKAAELAACYHALPPGGRVFISTWGSQTLAPVPEASAINAEHPHPSAIIQMLVNAGFITVLDSYRIQRQVKVEAYKECLRNRDISDLQTVPDAEIERYCSLLPKTEIMDYAQHNWIIVGIKLQLHHPNIALRRSPTHGIGAYCRSAVAQGEVILPLLTEPQTKPIVEPTEWHTSKEGIRLHLQRTTYGLINHGETPNCGIDGPTQTIRTLCALPAGTELSLNYSEYPLPARHVLA